MYIDVARQFSRVPAGRYIADGPYSGEAFRSKLLVPALESAEKVEVRFDGARGYGSSFLEEAFGGLVRMGRWTSTQLLAKLKLVSEDDPSICDEVISYIADEESRTNG